MYEHPKTFADAKKLVASPAGVEFEKYPLKFVTPGTPAKVNSGSVSLLRLNGQPFSLTCWHVLEGYRQRLAKAPVHFPAW